MEENDPRRKFAAQMESNERHEEDAPKDLSKRRTENAEKYLEGKEDELTIEEKKQLLRDTEIVVSIGQIMQIHGKRKVDSNQSHLERNAIDRMKQGLLMDGDAEGERQMAKVVGKAIQDRNDFFSSCRRLVDKHGLDVSKAKKELAKIRQEQKDLVKEYHDAEPPEVLSGFSDEDRDTITDQTFAIEMTKGCSIGCNFCGFSAERGVKDAMTFSDAAWLATHTKGITPYFASDPLDYVAKDDAERTYADFIGVYEAWHGELPSTITAYPKGKKGEIQKVADRVNRISFSHMNRKRLVDDGLFSQTESGSLIPKDPAMVEHLFNSMKFVGTVLDKFQNPKTPKMSRGIYFQHLTEGYAGDRIIVIDGNDETVKAGRGRKEDQEDPTGTILCEDGVLITIDGTENIVRTFSTSKYEQGLIRAEITPDSLSGGQEQFQDFKKSLDDGGQILLEDILPYCVVLKNRRPSNAEAGFDIYSERKKQLEAIEQPSEQEEKKLALLGTRIVKLNVSGTIWDCRYSEISGQVLELAA